MAGRFLARRLAEDSRGGSRSDGWQDEVHGSRLERDLRIRTRFIPLFYGPSRRELERFVTESPDLLHVGCQHFAAQPYDWVKLAAVLVRGASRVLGLRVAKALAR